MIHVDPRFRGGQASRARIRAPQCVPVPDSGTVWVAPPPATSRLALAPPTNLEVKVMVMVQLEFAGTLVPQLLVSLNSPELLWPYTQADLLRGIRRAGERHRLTARLADDHLAEIDE